MNHTATAAKAAYAPKASKPAPFAATEQIVEAEPTFEQIRQRAYEIFLARGDEPGDDLQDWLKAEHELRSASS
ncbi:MAG TPA: DUF2934 domain-containing protein [Candidatus Acidoferrales bacterium]|nr:DUF2934 domain-containing protein [Candidatus Acidoferrales bacterium]